MAPFGSTPNCGTGTDSGSAVAIADKPIVLNEQDVFSQLIVHGVAEVRASQDRTFLELHVPLPFSSVATAQDAQNFLVAGVVANGGGPASQLQAIRLSPYAELVDTEPFTVNGSGNAKDRVQVAFNGTSYLIVWQQFRDPDWDIYAARVSPAGTVLDNPAVVVASAPEDELEPSVSSDGSAFLVTWTHRSGATADDIRARRVSGDGVVVDAQAFVVSAGASDESRAYSASLEARRWLVGYTADGRIRYRFLDASPDLGGPGTVCSQASACASGFCADGVCCNSACAGGSADCQACNVAGSLGTCSTRPSGSSCDDGRACTTSDVCSGTVCQGNQASCGVTAPVLVAPNGPGVGPRPTYRWNAVTNATHYTLWVNDPTGTRINTMYAAADVGCATGTACSIRPATALNAGSAKFWVQAQAGAIKSPWSAALSFTVATAVPAVPTLIAPSGTQNTATPTYRFSRIADATDYYLWVNDSRGTRIKQFVTPAQAGCTTTSACSVTPTIALNTGSAKFWVQARNELGLSAWGLGMAFTVSAVFAPPVLTSPSGTINTTTPAYVWSAVPGATAYDLWVDDSTGNRINTTYTASDAGCASAATCTLTPSVVLATGPAKWWVRARDTSRASAWSAVRNFSVAP
jgi:hypothetical protein